MEQEKVRIMMLEERRKIENRITFTAAISWNILSFSLIYNLVYVQYSGN